MIKGLLPRGLPHLVSETLDVKVVTFEYANSLSVVLEVLEGC